MTEWVVMPCRWARKLLLLEFAFYMLWLLSFQVFMLLFQVTLTSSYYLFSLGGYLGSMHGYPEGGGVAEGSGGGGRGGGAAVPGDTLSELLAYPSWSLW